MSVPPRAGPSETAGVADAGVPPGAGVQAAATSATEARTMEKRFTVILPRPSRTSPTAVDIVLPIYLASVLAKSSTGAGLGAERYFAPSFPPRRGSRGHDEGEGRPGPVRLDRRQRLDDRATRKAHRRRGQAGRAGDVLAGALLRTVLLSGAGLQALQLYGEDPRRSDHEADAGPGEKARDRAHRADVRGGPDRGLLQHRRGHRRRWEVPGKIPQDAYPARQRLLGEVLLPSRQPRVSGLRHCRREGRRLHLLRPPLPGG